MQRLLSFLIIIILLTSCSSIVISPQPQAGSHIDMAGQRISQTTNGVKLAARIYETSVRPSPAEQNYCSVWIELTNLRSVLLPLQLTDFMLIDNRGRQYQAVKPTDLVERLTLNIPHLIPYPYVGFYYLGDSSRARTNNHLSSEGSYFSSRRPEHIKTDALPLAEVLPASTIAGALYFPAELGTMKSFRLQYQIGTLAGQKTFQISLPFTVEKK